MTEPTPTVVVQQNGTTTGRLIDASKSILSVIPPSFLGLCLINALFLGAFLGAILWFLNSQVEARMALVAKIIDVCVLKQH
jgi:hypothetical protein